MNNDRSIGSIPASSRDWNGRVIALASLLLSFSSLSYNTWRNETTESHRNVRQASFQLLDQIGRMQQIVDSRYYAGDRSEMTRIEAWGKAALIRDMGSLVSPTSAQRAQTVFDTWSEHADGLDHHDPEAEEAISASLGSARGQILADLRVLR